ncbi:MAG: nucleoside hydrolase [Thermoproteota archaeon]
MSAKPIVLDTDIGDDIDDALTLLFALKCRELDLQGVTVVFGDIESRARLASKLVSTVGRNVKVALGASLSLAGFKPGWNPCQAEVLEGAENEYSSIVRTPAWELIKEEAAVNSRLHIVTIGPLTNLALAVLSKPDMKANVTSMAGFFNGQGAEYNVKCDPEALHIVLRSGLNPYLVGLDVTLKCPMPMSMVERLNSSQKPEHRLMSLMIKAWSNHTGNRQPILHDPLALATVVDDKIVTFEKTRVEVELRGEYTRGFTLITGRTMNASIGVDVDVERFLRLFEEVIFS